MIQSSWKRENGKTEVSVTVPPNCMATVFFPNEDGRTVHDNSGQATRIGEEEGYTLFEVTAGKYRFSN